MKVEDDVRYLTANTPPTDDNSNKVPTTEWVQEKLDDTVGGGMNATVKATTYNSGTAKTYAPSGGGTWWCYGNGSYQIWDSHEGEAQTQSFSFNGAFASGAVIHGPATWYGNAYNSRGFGIKIA